MRPQHQTPFQVALEPEILAATPEDAMSCAEALADWEAAVYRGDAMIDLRSIVRMASRSRVACLFVERERCAWSAFDPRSVRLEQADVVGLPCVTDLTHTNVLNTLAALVLQRGGDVFYLEPGRVPGPHWIAAILR